MTLPFGITSRSIRTDITHHYKLWNITEMNGGCLRRPLTSTGTNLLGLVKHCAVSESRYFGEVFGRPFPEPLPRWDDLAARGADFWATEHEPRDAIVGLYRRVWEHSDATINALAIDAPGYVPWWREDVKLFNIMVQCLAMPLGTPDTPISCANSSTGQWVWTPKAHPCTGVTAPSGRPGARKSSRPPEQQIQPTLHRNRAEPLRHGSTNGEAKARHAGSDAVNLGFKPLSISIRRGMSAPASRCSRATFSRSSPANSAAGPRPSAYTEK
jgi:hypothetical protein